MDRTPADPSQEGEVEPKKVLKKVQQRANQRQKKKFCTFSVYENIFTMKKSKLRYLHVCLHGVIISDLTKFSCNLILLRS